MASSAAPYSPLFYVLVGPTSLPFEGAGSLYALRAAAALLCAILIAISFTVLRRWSKTTWPAMALMLALTPTFTYSVSMAAPNGLELAAALAVWVALLGIARAPARRPPTRLVGLTGVAGVLVAATRGLGPLWLLLIVGTVSLLVPWHALRHILKTRGVRHAALAGTLATLFAGWWVLASESTEVSSRYHFDDSPWAALPAQWVLWFFQSIAAFPARDELAPLALYVIAFAAWGLLVFLGLRVANGREKFAMTVVVVASTAVASSIIIATYETLGAAWQGRYGYPYTLGFLLLCGFALDRSGRWPAARWPVVAAAITMWMLLLIGHLDVLADQTRTSSLAGSDAWLQPHPALVIVLDTLGCALLLRSLMPWRVISVAPDSLPEWTGSRTTVSTSSGGPAAHS